MAMAAGDLELAGDIPPTVMVMVVDMADMADTMADTMEVPIGVAITTVITMAIMTDIMAAADITIPLHMHMVRWIAEALTGIPGLLVPPLQVQMDQPMWTQKIEFRHVVARQPAVLATMSQLRDPTLRPLKKAPRSLVALHQQIEVM